MEREKFETPTEPDWLVEELDAEVEDLPPYDGYLAIPPLFADATIDDFDPLDFAVAAMRSSAASHRELLEDEEVGDLLLCGGNGVGKSHLAAALAHQWRYAWCPMSLLMVRIRRTFSARSEESELSIVEELADLPRLVIDDLLASNRTDFGMATILCLLDLRITNRRRTIVTIDRSLEDVDKIDSSLASRLGGFARVVMQRDDRRSLEV